MEEEHPAFLTEPTIFWRRLGLFPFSLENGRYKFCSRYIATATGAAFVSCACTIYYHWREDYSRFPSAHYSNISVGLLFRVLLPLYSCYLVYFKSPQFKSMMERFEEVDRSLIRSNFVVMFPPKWRYACHITYIVFSFAYELSVNTSRYDLIISFYIGRLVWTFNVLQLVDLLTLFENYFGVLANLVSTSCTVRQLQSLVDTYHRLCVLVSSFQELFGLSLLLVFSHLFIFIVSYVYLNIVRQFFLAVNLEIVGFTFITLPIFIIQLVRPCYRTTNSASEFTTVLYRHMQRDKTNQISADNKLSLHITMQRSVIFTALEFFTVDYTLIYSMVTAATTYFVILVQFGSSPA